MIGVLKNTMKGDGVTQYLPSSVEEMMEKLALLYGELSAGNTTVLPQIVALLGKFHQKGEISYNDYECFCEQLDTTPQMIDVMDDAKKCDGVTQYLPSSDKEMKEKLALLCGELTAGNNTVLPQIVSLIGKLHQKGEISYDDYKSVCEQLVYALNDNHHYK